MLARLGTTRWRLTLLSVGMLSIAVLLADLGILSLATISTASASDAALKRLSDRIVAGLQLTDSGAAYLGGGLPTQADDGLATDVSVIGLYGLVTSTADNPLRNSTLEALAAPVLRTRRAIWVDIADARHVQRRVYAVPVTTLQNPVVLIVERSVESQNASLGAIRWLLLSVSALFVTIGGLVAYLQTGRVLKPVREISTLARTLSERDLHRRVDLPVPEDELGDLVHTFNAMLGRLEAAFDSMSRFIADASHELRAPLTHVRNIVELSGRRSDDPQEHIRALHAIDGEVTHMSDMIDKLLLLARADAGVLRPALTGVDVADLMLELEARWLTAARQSDVTLDVEAPDSGLVLADPTLTRRILDNLVENAIRHSPRHSHVSLRARCERGAWIFEVADQGAGVPPALTRRIFDRFARADDARTRNGLGGTGLGLAVSSSLAQVQEASLVLAETGPRGSLFRLTFEGSGTNLGEAPSRGARLAERQVRTVDWRQRDDQSIARVEPESTA